MRPGQRGGIIFRLLSLIMLGLLVAAIYFARYPLLRFAGNWWEVQDKPEHSDAIIILSDDNFNGERATKAAELYHASWAPLIVASGRLLRPYAGIAELMEHDLEARGVPADAILRFPHKAANTREEAQALRALAMNRGWRHVIVVTSNYHTRRARYILSKIFPAQIGITMISAKDSDYDPDSWWESRESRKIFLMEAEGYPVAMWELSDANSNLAPASNQSAPAATPAK
jgi:uncharacterized SAM-binding protein YcdF (DUF218 family)